MSLIDPIIQGLPWDLQSFGGIARVQLGEVW